MELITEHWFLLVALGGILGMYFFLPSRKDEHGTRNRSNGSHEYEDAGITIRHISHESENYHAGCCCSPEQAHAECKMK